MKSNGAKDLLGRFTPPLLGICLLLALAGCPGTPEVDASLPDAVVPMTDPELSVMPPLQDFGDVPVGDESAERTFTFRNTGDGPTAALNVTLEGAGAAQFVITENGCAGMRLAPSAMCTVEVQFAPTAAGRASATLRGTDGAVSASASLNGRGASAAGLTISPTPVTFPTTTVGESSAARTFTVRNGGESASGMISVMLAGADPMQFDLGTDNCSGRTLAAGATCTIEVSYGPVSAGSHSASLEVSASPGGLVSAAMSGMAVTPSALRVAPMSQNFGSSIVGVAGTPVTFNVINSGGVATGALRAALTGPNASEFSITSDTCSGGPLAGGATCSIGVRFTAASPGDKMASLDVGDGTLSVSAALTAMGQAPGSITIEPTTHDFGMSPVGVATGATTFTVRNTGGADTGPLTTAIAGANPGDFAIVSDGCAATVVAPMDTCTVAVHFQPTAAGARSASLRVVGTPGGTAMAALSGTGQSPASIDVTPTSQNFGSIATGSTSTNVTFTVRNTGMSPTGVPAVALIGVRAFEFEIVANTCTAAIPGMGMCAVTVRFAPTTSGAKTAQLEVTATPGGRDVADLSGTGITPAALAATPGSSPRDFNAGGAITPETMTFTASVGIINNGAETSGPLSVSVTGAGAAAFSTSGCAGMALMGGATCTITVTFSPTAQTAYSANLVVTGAPGGTVTVPLSGVGTPDIEISGPNFSDTRTGDTSMVLFTVTNRTTTARTFSTRTITGTHMSQFTITGGTCNPGVTSLAEAPAPGGVGGICTIIVQFAPTGTVGARMATLNVTTTMGGAESAPLTGNAAGPVRIIGWRLLSPGPSPSITPCPTGVSTSGLMTSFPASFGTFTIGGATPNIQLCVRNENTMSPAGDSGVITTTDALPADMRLVHNDCNGTNLPGGIGPSSQCSMVVRWFPGSAGTSSGTVSIAYGANSTSAVVTGTAQTASPVTVPSPVDFGTTVATNTTTRTVAVSNPGSTGAIISSAFITGSTPGTSWAITGNSCPVGGGGAFVVPAGGSCTLTITFTPSTAAASSPAAATLSLMRASFAPVTAALQGAVTSQLGIAGTTTFTTPVGTPQTRTYTITNNSANPVASVSCNLGSQVGGGTWTRSNLCAGSLAAGASCSCEVTFSHTAGTNSTIVVTATSTAGTYGSASLTLSGTAQTNATFLHEPATLPVSRFDLGQVRNGTNGAAYRFTVRNIGTLTSSMITATSMGANPADFNIVGNTCTMLAGGATCFIDVRFGPNMTGVRTADIVVSAGSASTTIFVQGTGVADVVTISPNIFDFGASAVGVARPSQVFTITNNGSSSASGAVATGSGAFLVSMITCGGTLAPGASCQVRVTYTPTAVGLQTATLVYGTASALLRGRGLAPAALSLTPGSVSFGSQPVGTSSSPVTFTVRNTGGVAAPAINPIAVATNPSHYTVSSSCNGVVLAADDGAPGGPDQCSFTIAFSPQLVGGYGSRPGSVTVTAGSGGGMVSSGMSSLSGTGVNPAVLGLTPSIPIDCRAGNLFARMSSPVSCTATWTLSNAGDVPATGIGWSFSGGAPFSIVSYGPCGPSGAGSLGAGATCTLTAVYDPQTVRTDSGTTFTVTSANAGMVMGTINETAVSAMQHTTTVPGGHAAGSISFGTGTPVLGSVRRTINLRNGDGVLSFQSTGILRYSITGTNASDFDVTGADTCTGQILASNDLCSMEIEFVPTAAGNRTATLTVDDGTPERSIVIALSGN